MVRLIADRLEDYLLGLQERNGQPARRAGWAAGLLGGATAVLLVWATAVQSNYTVNLYVLLGLALLCGALALALQYARLNMGKRGETEGRRRLEALGRQEEVRSP